ncbi:sensor histidine kinase [Cystobacter fuscus]|uniref:sensor histidine kinase n=1 Tax=Cystobacter fuscus TaxID=43 RepID=UPI0037BE71E1
MKMQSKVLVVAAMGAVLVASASALSRQPTFVASVCLMGVSLMGVWATLHGQPLRRAYGWEEEGMGLGEFARWTPVSPGAGFPRAVEDGSETRRRNAEVEKAVRQRTSELELANARLGEQLRQLQVAQARRISAERWGALHQLSVGLSHELSDPLTILLGNIDYVQLQLGLSGASCPEEQVRMSEALADARQVAERIRRIAEDLERLSVPADLEDGPVDVVATLRGAMEKAALEGEGRARWVSVLHAVPRVRSDRARLHQVFQHLFTHAARELPLEGEVPMPLQLSVRMSNASRVVVEMSAGRGLPAENPERVFQPFVAPRPSRVGTGLELAVCHRLVTALGGEMSVHNEPGRGSFFCVELPTFQDA